MPRCGRARRRGRALARWGRWQATGRRVGAGAAVGAGAGGWGSGGRSGRTAVHRVWGAGAGVVRCARGRCGRSHSRGEALGGGRVAASFPPGGGRPGWARWRTTSGAVGGGGGIDGEGGGRERDTSRWATSRRSGRVAVDRGDAARRSRPADVQRSRLPIADAGLAGARIDGCVGHERGSRSRRERGGGGGGGGRGGGEVPEVRPQPCRQPVRRGVPDGDGGGASASGSRGWLPGYAAEPVRSWTGRDGTEGGGRCAAAVRDSRWPAYRSVVGLVRRRRRGGGGWPGRPRGEGGASGEWCRSRRVGGGRGWLRVRRGLDRRGGGGTRSPATGRAFVRARSCG